MNADTQKPNNNKMNNNYVRTKEDEENDRREREWKERRNREALESFNRLNNVTWRYPDDLNK